MIHNNHAFILILTISFCFGLLSCEVADSNKEWGFAKVYMPQSIMQSGGTDNNYYVPWGNSEFDKNYVVNQNQIDVVLGVYRSGLQELEAYDVDIIAKTDTVTHLIENEILTEAVLLPEDAYTLPASISVSNGEREATFYLSVDRQKLLDDYPSFSGQRLVLAVGITNPTRYELNPELSTTIVIVDEWETLE